MKRLWLGVGILAAFLMAGCLLTASFHGIHAPLSASLEDASRQALAGNWEAACDRGEEALRQWERYRNLTAAVADHAPLEEMDALFSQMEIYVSLNWQGEFAAVSMQLSKMAAAMEESQALTWWTLL